jgi:hypothetical protein
MIYLRQAAVVLLIVSIGIGIGTLASAHGGDTTKIHACVTGKGTVRIVKPAEACKRGETPLDWSAQGAGGAGSLEIVEESRTVDPQSDPQSSVPKTASCPSGKKVSGGGARLTEGTPDEHRRLVGSYPVSSTAWIGEVYDLSGSHGQQPYQLRVYAICIAAS